MFLCYRGRTQDTFFLSGESQIKQWFGIEAGPGQTSSKKIVL